MSKDREKLNLTSTILLVDDEASVRNLVARFLGLSGFNVLVAEHPRVALELWAAHKAEIDLLLTDMVMPGGMNGRELAAQFQAERPELKVLYTSGYSLESLSDEDAPGGTVHFLQKPYRPEQLALAVRDVLADRASPQPEFV